jgi:SAM-dependent methyltransferase
MDEYDGKQFLATIRSADYAHAGEAESIDLVFGMLPAQPGWRVLDVGCGRGGTADYVSRHEWGLVTGVDIDKEAIGYARGKYPNLEFATCDMHSVGDQFPEQFDLIYLFNVFYTACDKPAAMMSFRKAARQTGLLGIFDYVMYKTDRRLPSVFLGQKPATFNELDGCMNASSWKLIKNVNLDDKYIEWYRNFLQRFEDPSLSKVYPSQVIADVRSKYAELLDSIEQGILGGAFLLFSAH